MSLEQDDRGDWMVTDLIGMRIFQSWYAKQPKHLMLTWLAFSCAPNTTFKKWFQATCQLESYGIPAFSEVTWQQLIAIVDSHADDPVEST